MLWEIIGIYILNYLFPNGAGNHPYPGTHVAPNGPLREYMDTRMSHNRGFARRTPVVSAAVFQLR